jgi:transcription elongation factor GreB
MPQARGDDASTTRAGYTIAMAVHQNRSRQARAPFTGAAGERNYITPQGYARLKAELTALLDHERPELVKVISWAASNGDRSENGDYIYGKKRLREIDRRIYHLGKRLDNSVVVDPAERADTEQIFFGATVTYETQSGAEHTISIVGLDEVDLALGRVSWISPIAKALLRKSPGDRVRLTTPGGDEEIEVLAVRYDALP